MESSFLELRCKEVVNVCDGKRLGHITDIVFDLGTACVLGFVLPGEKTGWNLFKPNEQIFLPYRAIVRIGEDTILVELPPNNRPINPYILSQKGERK
ncbi:MAG: YlmC/YmxH family sporulation protein [Clostridia bacterium]|nr:YlmC/YmxH family sporulation protein [Clostridia bacterium]